MKDTDRARSKQPRKRAALSRARVQQPAAGKQPFAIDQAMHRIQEAVRPFPKAALFELAEEGFSSPFEQLVACLISIRTRDETTLPTARKLFARARTPATMSRLTPEEIDALINTSTFHERGLRWQASL
jgi:endonuclease-3